jgi:hypothetical protein
MNFRVLYRNIFFDHMKNVHIFLYEFGFFKIMILIGNIFLCFSEIDIIDSLYVSDPLS